MVRSWTRRPTPRADPEPRGPSTRGRAEEGPRPTEADAPAHPRDEYARTSRGGPPTNRGRCARTLKWCERESRRPCAERHLRGGRKAEGGRGTDEGEADAHAGPRGEDARTKEGGEPTKGRPKRTQALGVRGPLWVWAVGSSFEP